MRIFYHLQRSTPGAQRWRDSGDILRTADYAAYMAVQAVRAIVPGGKIRILTVEVT